MLPLNMKLRGIFYEGSLNIIFFAKLSLITSFSIHESSHKKVESSAPSDCEMRAVIKFLNSKGVTGLEIYRRLSNVHMVHLIAGLKPDLGGLHLATEEDL